MLINIQMEARDSHYNYLLTDDQVKQLKSSKRDWIAYFTIARVWITLALMFSITIIYPTWWTFLLAVMVIGSYQFGLVVLMHEASHGLLHSNRKTNDFLGEWMCAFPVMSTLSQYRPYHAQHHKYTELKKDPDLVLSRPFPVTKASFIRKILRDLSGIAGLRRYYNTILSVTKNASGLSQKIINFVVQLRGFIAWNIPIAIAMTYFGSWYSYLLFWWVPLLTWYSLIYRLRNISEHVLVPNTTELDFVRTTTARVWYRWLIAPLNVNYHSEHHFFPWCPWYLLPKAHNMIVKNQNTEKMCIERSYFSMLSGIFA